MELEEDREKARREYKIHSSLDYDYITKFEKAGTFIQ